jgi:uncharacterized protein (TIGR03085 family)
MSRLARTERSALCDLALEVGGDAPTLSGDWTVKDLVVHLLVREGNPAAVGIVVPPLAGVTEWASRRLAREDLTVLVQRLRQGPPVYSPFRLAPVEAALNTLEYFVHHEDIRRARPGWEPRALPDPVQDVLWKMIRTAGKPLARKARVGVVLERLDGGNRAVVSRGQREVVVRGLPAELVLFLNGRSAQARVALDGAPEDVEELSGAPMGF